MPFVTTPQNYSLPVDTTTCTDGIVKCMVNTLTNAEICMIFVPVVLYWVYSGILYVVTNINSEIIQKYKIPQSGRALNKVDPIKVLVSVLSQHLVQMICSVLFVNIFRDTTQDVEGWLLMIAKIWAGTFVMDSYQYWLHRYFHYNKFLYKSFHSVHHRLLSPYAFGALYNHPVEGFLLDTVGGGISSFLLNMHPWTSCVFFSLATLKTVDDHSGYNWPWDPFHILFSNNAAYHDLHHYGVGKMYNFSQPFYTFWDKLMDTELRVPKEEESKNQKKIA